MHDYNLKQMEEFDELLDINLGYSKDYSRGQEHGMWEADKEMLEEEEFDVSFPKKWPIYNDWISALIEKLIEKHQIHESILRNVQQLPQLHLFWMSGLSRDEVFEKLWSETVRRSQLDLLQYRSESLKD